MTSRQYRHRQFHRRVLWPWLLVYHPMPVRAYVRDTWRDYVAGRI